MEFVRKIVNSTELVNVIDIPKALVNKKVEILVLPIEENKKKTNKKRTATGFLSKYANPKLIEQEEGIWQKEAKE